MISTAALKGLLRGDVMAKHVPPWCLSAGLGHWGDSGDTWWLFQPRKEGEAPWGLGRQVEFPLERVDTRQVCSLQRLQLMTFLRFECCSWNSYCPGQKPPSPQGAASYGTLSWTSHSLWTPVHTVAASILCSLTPHSWLMAFLLVGRPCEMELVSKLELF